ncbi:MAG TPA: DUF2269 family protein [Thermomicrobiales bacterium]|nr:DUF2269 family protein [Thermomicrobiales bacterium]
MDSLYLLLKFLHVAGVVVWVGGMVALVTLNARIGRSGDMAAVAAMGAQSEAFGRTVVGPAMGLTLLAGLATAGVARLSFGTSWIVWGLVGFVLSIAIGVIAVSRAAAELGALAPSASPDDPRLGALRNRLLWLNAINLLVLASVVWAMVFKPSF